MTYVKKNIFFVCFGFGFGFGLCVLVLVCVFCVCFLHVVCRGTY